jgi:arylsulfatase A-like enzyme
MKVEKPVVILIISLAFLAFSIYITYPAQNRVEEGEIECPGCNIILITFDALRADHLGCYGYGGDISPNIDSLAGKSYVFTDSMSQCGSTPCSFPSLHTSKFPVLDRILINGTILRDRETTIAEILREHGYATYAVVAVNLAKAEYGVNQGFDVYDDEFTDPEDGFKTRERVVGILEEIAALKSRKDKPVFLWVHFREPHSPYNPDIKTFNKFYPNPGNEPTVYRFPGPEALRGGEDKEELKKILRYYSSVKREPVGEYIIFGDKLLLTPTMVKQYEAMYDGNIRKIDGEFSILMEYIKKSSLSKNTVIIVSADHGESLGEHDVFDHNNVYYGMLHTPLIVHLPTNKHMTLDYPVMNVDILPTILGILGIEPGEDGWRGRNLFDGGRGDYKLILNINQSKGSLYDVAQDPEERYPLGTGHKEKARELLGLWNEMKPTENKSEGEEVDTLEKLREIGYAY